MKVSCAKSADQARPYYFRPLSGLVPSTAFSVVSLLLAAVTLPAQSTPLGNDQAIQLEAFEVNGIRSSLATSIEAKRQSGQVTDIITAEQIGLFGDQNIGEAIQRISGVSLTRSNGEGESISIRGLSPVFTRVEIDGRSTAVTADSADPGRDSLLSGFSSDLYNSIEVIKSPTAADIEGGVGGIVRLKTPNPLEVGKLAWGIEGSLTDAEARDRNEPGFNGFYSNVFADGRLGVLLSASYEKRDRRIDKVQSGDPVWAEVSSSDPALDGGRYPERLRLESRKGDLPKFNLNAKVQFMATPQLELYANTVFTREERDEDKARVQVEFSRGTFLDGEIDPVTGTLIAGEFNRQRVDYTTFERDAVLETLGLTGGAKWKGEQWNLQAEASFTQSSENYDEYRARSRTNRDGIGGYELGDDPRTPRLYTASLTAPLSSLVIDDLSLDRREITISESDIQVDAKRHLGNHGFTSFEAGLRWAQTEFERQQGQLDAAVTKGDGSDLTFADGTSPFVIDGSFGLGKGGDDFLTTWPSVAPKPLYDQYAPTTEFTFNDPNRYTITEDNTAAYALVNYTQEVGGSTVRGNLGLRFVRTQFSGEGRVRLITTGGTFVLDEEPSVDRDYTEALPAFNFNVAPGGNENVLIRGAITRALTRPTISEINPSSSIDVDDAEIARGSADLDPFLAWQYDLGVEFYFGASQEGLFSINGFYKDVDNFIVATSLTENRAFPEQGVAAQDYLVSTYRNGGAASIQGVEFNLQSPFSFLPGPLAYFGGVVNYTYTDSEFTDVNGFSYSFPGASSDTYNLVLYYERAGFSGRLAYNYRNEYLIEPSTESDGANAIFGAGSGRLDLSLRYRFANGFRVSVDVLNLIEEQDYKYYDITQRYQNLEFEGRIYSMGVGYSF